MFAKSCHKIVSCFLAVVMVVLLMLSMPASTHSNAANYTDATITKLQQAIDKLAGQIEANKAELNKISAEQDDVEKQAELIDNDIALTTEKITQVEALLTELSTQISDIESAIAEKSADIDEQYERFKNRVRIAYEEGNVSYLEMVFGATSMSDFLSRFEYINAMVEYDNNLMKNYKRDKELLEEEKLTLEAAKSLQEETKLSLEDEKKKLEEQQEKVDQIRSDLRAQYAEAWAEYQKSKEEDEKLNKELEDYIKKLQAQNNKVYVGGDFIWPLDLKYSRVSSYFGGRWLWGYWDDHYGMDIPCDLNANVYACNGGTVIKAEWHYSYGNYVIIDHGGGKTTLYAHNNSLNVVYGQEVSQGQVIAYAGTTGSSQGVHCHLEYRVNGVRYDPLLVVVQP